MTLPRVKLRAAHAFIGHDGIVVIAAAEGHAIVALMPAGRQPVGNQGFGENGFSLLLRRQIAGELQSEKFLVLEGGYPRIFPLVHITRFRAHEGRRQRHLLAEDEAGDDQMMTAQLPAPRLGRRRLTEEVQLIAPLAEQPRRADELAEKGVQLHQIARLLVARGAQTRLDDRHRRVFEIARNFVEPQPKVLIAHDAVLPELPFARVERQTDFLFLLGVEQRYQRACGAEDFARRRRFGLEREQARNDVAIRGDALERRRQKLFDAASFVLAARRQHEIVKLLMRQSEVEGFAHLRNEFAKIRL